MALPEIGRLVGALGSEIRDVLIAALILGSGVLIALLIRANMRRSLSQRLPPYVYKPLENITFYSIIFAATIAALKPFGIDLGSLLVAGGLASIVIGLAAQNTLSDVISGLFLLVEQPIRVGDPVELEGITGEVIDIRVLSTLIRTWDGHLVRIPNKRVFDDVIANFSRTRARRIDFSVSIHYESDLERAIEVIREFIGESPYCLLRPAPEVYVDAYGDSGIILRIRCWTPTRLWYPAKMSIQTGLKDALTRAGIKIPYPQLDVHLVESKPRYNVVIEEEKGKTCGSESRTETGGQ